MSRPKKEKYSVLLVDDSPDDLLFMRRAIHQHPRLIVVGEVHDGEDAISYLSGQEPFNDRNRHPFPDVILLDLKMPRKTGFDVLQWLQGQLFDKLLVAVVSGSFLPEDINRSMALGADAYYKKSPLKEERDLLVQAIENLLDNS